MTSSVRREQRRQPEWWTPARLPRPFTAYASNGAGHGAAVGLLDVDVAVVAGASRVVRQFHRTPLYVLRPLYLDPAYPGMAFMYVQQHGDGIVQGDRLRIDVDVAAGAQLHLTTQAATKVYGMDTGYAVQLVNIAAGPDSVVEYLPDPVIPFRGSRLYGEVTLTVDPSATVMFADTLLPGRTNEHHDYDIYWTTTRVQRSDGELLVSDTLCFGEPIGRADTPARLAGYPVHATLFVIAPSERVGALADVLVDQLPCSDVICGVSILPRGCGVGVRILGHTPSAVNRTLRAAWQSARIALLGAAAPDLRKG